MTLDRLALSRPASTTLDWSGDRRRSALDLVRHGAASWRGFRTLERSVLEGALALARKSRGQTLFVALHGPRSFADRRLDMLEVKAIDPARPFGLMRDLLRAALARPDARSAASTLPADLLAYLKSPVETVDAHHSHWPAAIADFFAALPLRAPLMIVLDRAHRADADSLSALDALARRIAESRILLIVTHPFDAPIDSCARPLIDARLARAMIITAPQADNARMLFQSAFGRSARPETIAASLTDDEAGLLLHGLTSVEVCRRAGRWSDAKALAERIIAAGEANQAQFIACAAAIALGHLLADQGKWDESLERLEHIQPTAEAIKEDELIAWLYWGLARARWGQADRRRAFQTLRLAQAVSARATAASLRAAIALCGVEWLADNRRGRAARDWLDAIERAADHTHGLDIDAAYAAAHGAIAFAENDAIAATGFFRAALRKSTALSDEYAAARARTRLAAALLARDDSDSRRDGREELVEAHIAFSRLGAASDVSAVEALGAQHGVRPRARRASANGSASPGGITPREREVLELLVRGLTNRQIAATLSITEKTAEGHVSNILAKLGVASRGQAAGYAVANGLLEAAEA